ncbi:MAG TPA: multidrug efflux RND transporter permease subunit [Caulobacteraceae bacterium]
MKIAHFFVDRPVFAAVVSILITLLGIIAYPTLPVSQYPPVAPPTVVISATYPGASAETMADTVATPIEQQVNGVEDMLYMSSQSTGNGQVSITITFKLGTDLDKAQVLVQNRVAVAEPRLPEQVRDIGVTVRKASPDFMLAVQMYSPDKSKTYAYVANYAALEVKDRLLRIEGVGDINLRGARDYAMRIWIDPDRAAARGITVEDITSAIASHNTQVAGGTVGSPPFGSGGGAAYQLNIQALGRLSLPSQFANIIVKRVPGGAITRISDIARVEMGAQDYTSSAYWDAIPAVNVGILQLPGGNALQTADEIIRTMEELKKDFPPGIAYAITYNPTNYIRASVDEVQKTLFIALLLVVFVIIVFLQSWRASIIPILAIPISLIGTFAVMKAFGFSVNNLTLFGLVLAIGIVVDDAIVVVENVERHLRAGMTPREAAHVTMDEVGGALVAIALVLGSVFIPAAFVTGITGQFYRQFALTIASATVFSLLVSLTLSPAVAALILKPHDHQAARGKGIGAALARFGEGFNHRFDQLSDRYAGLTRWLLGAAGLVLVVYVAFLALTGWRLMATPGGFIPAVDQGNFIVSATLPPGTSLERTDVLAQQLRKDLTETPGIFANVVIVGADATSNTLASNSIQIFAVEKDFAQRLGKKNQDLYSIMDAVRKRTAKDIVGADVRVIQQPAVRGIGTAGGFKMIVEDRGGKGLVALEQAARAVAAEATKSGVVTNAFVTFNNRTPRIFADIDRDKAEYLGVPDSRVFDTLQTYLGGSYVSDFNLVGHTFQVTAQADAPFRQDPASITQLQTRADNGNMTPLGAVLNIQRIQGPYRALRYNLFPGAEVQGDPAPGHSSGEALKAMQDAAQKVLPEGFSWEWTELAYQQQLAGNSSAVVFVLAVVFVFLLLAALYESITLPLAVILIVPMCLLGATAGINLRGIENNILVQIGFIVLIGLAAKNAILIIEFARQNELEKGMGRWEAAIDAARVRLRPILMTSFAFILGVAPLVFASGAGAELRQALGTTVFAGMIGVTGFGLIFTPVFYVVCRNISDHLPQPSRPPPQTPTTGGRPHSADEVEAEA